MKNSWGSTWNGDGYRGNSLRHVVEFPRFVHDHRAGAYFTNAMQTVTWDTSTSAGYKPGTGNWSTTTNANYGWSPDGTTLSAWRNGEDAAVFDGGGGTYNVNVDYGISATPSHSIAALAVIPLAAEP